MTASRRFGLVAAQYDQARPGYPGRLLDDVLGYAGLGVDARVLDLGAGTGQATFPLAERGLEVVALEPSAEMASVLRHKSAEAGFRVTIETTDIESSRLAPHAFDLVVAATSWHWFAPRVRWRRVAQALKPGGALAVFWNWPHWRRSALCRELDAAYVRSGVNVEELGPMLQTEIDLTALAAEWMLDAPDPDAFTDTRFAQYRWTMRYSADAYAALLGTYGDHIALAPDLRESLLGNVRAVIDANGGNIRVEYSTYLLLARAQSR